MAEIPKSSSPTCVPRDDLPEAAIEAAARRIERFGWPYREKSHSVARVMLTAALPHLVADKMVERAARSLAGDDYWDGSDLLTDAEREDWRRDARRALEAALSTEAHDG